VVVDGGQLVGAPSFRGTSKDLEGLGLA